MQIDLRCIQTARDTIQVEMYIDRYLAGRKQTDMYLAERQKSYKKRKHHS